MLTRNIRPLVVLLGACAFAIAYTCEKYWLGPWRARRRERRRIVAINQRLSRDVEAARQRFLAIRNGRTARDSTYRRSAR